MTIIPLCRFKHLTELFCADSVLKSPRDIFQSLNGHFKNITVCSHWELTPQMIKVSHNICNLSPMHTWKYYWTTTKKGNSHGQNQWGLKLWDRWPTGDRWQQRAQAKRIHPEAYTLPASCHLMRRRLRLSNCLPRWAPTGSLTGCSHAKWLQMRGMIRCWLRWEQNLPGNLATSQSQWLQNRSKSLCSDLCRMNCGAAQEEALLEMTCNLYFGLTILDCCQLFAEADVDRESF